MSTQPFRQRQSEYMLKNLRGYLKETVTSTEILQDVERKHKQATSSQNRKGYEGFKKLLYSSNKFDQFYLQKIQEFEKIIENQSSQNSTLLQNTIGKGGSLDFSGVKKFLDPQRLKKKLEEKGIPSNCADVIENGLYCYMERVLNEVFQVFQMMRNNDDTFRKKVYNFYNKDKRGSRQVQSSEYQNITLSDPLGEYKHFEKQDLQEQKLFENKIQNKESKADDADNKNTSKNDNDDSSSKKKKKVVFDDVSVLYNLIVS